MKAVLKLLGRVKYGKITVTLPEGEVLQLGEPQVLREADLQVQSYAFFTRLVFNGSIGMGEAFTEGLFTSSKPAVLLGILGDRAPL